MKRIPLQIALLAAAGLSALSLVTAETRTADADAAVPIKIKAARILNFKIGDPHDLFGPLKFVGGLELSSGNRDFGGISGFRFLPDRQAFLAVTDYGQVISGRFKRDIAGSLDSVRAEIAPLPGLDANFLTRKRDADAEAVELVDGRAYIAFERKHRIYSYTFADGHIAGAPVGAFPKIANLHLAGNAGIETLVSMPDNEAGYEFLAIAEDSPDEAGNHRGFLLRGNEIENLSLTRTEGFGITDADFLPDGDLLILERAYGLLSGPSIRIRRIGGNNIRPGALLDGPAILTADRDFRIDNMEALDVTSDADGRIYVALVSDDNFSALQSTIVLEFELVTP